MRLRLILLLPIVLILALVTLASAADIEITLTGIRNDSGSIRAAVIDHLGGGPVERSAVALCKEPARPGSLTLRFTGLLPGRYAVAIFHDEDDNGELRRFMGIFPLEGYALSGDDGRFGPPSFGKMAFDLTEKGATMVLAMHY